MKLPYKIYSNAKYWSFRSKLQKAELIFRKRKFQTKVFVKEENYKLKASFIGLKLNFWSILRALMLAISLFLIEYFSNQFWYAHFNSCPSWLIKFQQYIPKPTYPDDKEAIIELISVIASVTGVILALFYPILATIISTAYSKVHESIRFLILREKVSQEYLRKLASTTSFSISVLLALSFGINPGNLILFILFLLTLINLFNLLRIGLGVFTLFEPSRLLELLAGDIKKNIKDVTTEGLYWNVKKFQSDNYIMAYQSTENINLITQLCIQEYLKEGSLKSTIKNSLYILNYYLTLKPMIPIESLWFPSVYTHSSYFESDATYRNISKSTGTFIQPKTKQNHYWFEERLIDNISGGLQSVVKNGHITILSEVNLMSQKVLYSLGVSMDLKTGKIFLDTISKNIILLAEKKTDVGSYEDWKHELGCIETYCHALLSIQLGFFDRVAEINSSKIIAEFDKINWNKKDTIYSADFIPDLFEPLSKFQNNVNNEIIIEGVQITPNWYFRQSLTSRYLGIISEKMSEVVGFFESYLLSISNSYVKANNSLLTSFSAHIGLEILHKIEYRIAMLKETLIDIDKIEVCKGEFKWEKPNIEKIETQINKYQDDCLIVIAGSIEHLSLIKWNNQYPDVFAHSYSVLGSYLNDCFSDNDFEHFQLIFKPFLKSAITAFGNINKTFKHYNRPQDISYQTLIDIMEISGYAYIYSVIYKKPEFWISAKETWDANFLPSKENIEILISTYNYYKKTLYGTGINFTEKHQRERTLKDIVERLNLKPSDVEDLLVTPFIPDSHYSSFYNVCELFIEIYLFTFFPESKTSITLMNRDFFKYIDKIAPK